MTKPLNGQISSNLVQRSYRMNKKADSDSAEECVATTYTLALMTD